MNLRNISDSMTPVPGQFEYANVERSHVTLTFRERAAWLIVALVAVGASTVALVEPSLIGKRFVPIVDVPPDVFAVAARSVARSLAGTFSAVAVIAALHLFAPRLRTYAAAWWWIGAALLAYGSLASALHDWIVDDAGITLAYAKNVLEGHGLVLYPTHPREEGYSSTLWLLILVGAKALGFPIASAAKYLGLLSGAAAIALVFLAIPRITRRPDHAIPGAVLIAAPFVVWCSSGLEHGLQAALISLVITAPVLFSRRAIGVIAAALSGLILLRPETPLLVVAVTITLAFDRWHMARVRQASPFRVRELLQIAPVALVPFVVWCGLLAFRLWYFEDPWPNPYYAKAAGSASFVRALNPFGGSWDYVLQYLSSSHAFVVIPLVLLGRIDWNVPRPVRLAAAVFAAQLAFILYAGGDWMGQFRFIAPVLPALALLVAHGLGTVPLTIGPFQDFVVRFVVFVVLALGTVSSLVGAVVKPTTPMSIVSSIGKTFLEIGVELGVEHPSLAHHDAGGTSFEAGIDVVDLGGLGNRAVAKHMADRQFMLDYILNRRKPTFVFGGRAVFAAGKTSFFDDEAFARDYVPLVVEGAPFMEADLSYVRRDLVRTTDRIEVQWDEGQVVRVIVRLSR